MERSQKKKVVAICLVIALLITIIGVSYAFATLNLQGTRKQIITAGNLSLVLDEDENNLTLEEQLPMYDEVGMLQDAFTFRIINNTDVPTKYVLRLVDITTGEKLDTNIVKYGLVKNGSTKEIKLLSELDDGVIDTEKIDTIPIEYELRLWIIDSVEDESLISGKSLSYKLEITYEKVNAYTVDYDLNGGTAEGIISQTKQDGEDLILTDVIPTRDGYTFAGWSTSINGEVMYQANSIYQKDENITLYASWYENYTKGTEYTFKELDWYVLEDQSDKLVLISKSNINTTGVAYGTSTTFNGSAMETYLNDWISADENLQAAIDEEVIVYDESVSGYVRLAKKAEINTSVPNKSNTPFWTMTASSSSLWYAMAGGTFTYSGYNVSQSSSAACYYGGPYSSIEVLTANSPRYNKNASKANKNTIAAVTAKNVVTAQTYKSTTSVCASWGHCYIASDSEMVCGSESHGGYGDYSTGHYITLNWNVCAQAYEGGCNTSYTSAITVSNTTKMIGVRPVITVKKSIYQEIVLE